MTKQNKSNLSKTKPALRTKGGVTGNFGAGRRKGGSALNDVPANSRASLGSFPSEMEYRERMVQAYYLADTDRLRQFCLSEVARIDLKHGRGITRVDGGPKGAYCVIGDHFVGSHQ